MTLRSRQVHAKATTLATVLLAGSAALAQAQYGPVIAYSGRAGVPVIIHGRDATGAVVYGDWGLARPGGDVTVYAPGPFLVPLEPGAYFPRLGRKPRHGRLEIDTPRPLRPAERYHRSWSAGGSAPATLESNFPAGRDVPSAAMGGGYPLTSQEGSFARPEQNGGRACGAACRRSNRTGRTR